MDSGHLANGGQAGGQHPAPAEQVGQAAARQQQRPEGQRVPADDPLKLGAAICRSAWMVGSATATMLKSTWSTNWAAQMIGSVCDASLWPDPLCRCAPCCLAAS
jgi:hypothetical protein